MENKQLDVASELLNNILDNDISFRLAIANLKKTRNFDNEFLKPILNLIGCVLRHSIVFAEMKDFFLKEDEMSARNELYFYLANKCYLHNDFSYETIFEEKVSKETFSSLNDYIEGKTFLNPNNYVEKSIEWMSIKYNAPIWLIKMWKKHFGERLLPLMLIHYSKNETQTFMLLDESKEFLEKHPSYNKGENDVLYHYDNKNGYRHNKEYLSGKIVELPIVYKKIYDQIDFDLLKGSAFYIGNKNNFIIQYGKQFGFSARLDVMCAPGDSYFNIKKITEKYNMINTQLYECKPSSMITCISKKVHSLVLMPNNSLFNNAKYEPDYFLHFKTECLDELIENQKTCLNEAAELVECGGEIVYIVDTMNYRESKSVIKNFLHTHPEFSLIIDKQILPFDRKFNSSAYYAILRKGLEND